MKRSLLYVLLAAVLIGALVLLLQRGKHRTENDASSPAAAPEQSATNQPPPTPRASAVNPAAPPGTAQSAVPAQPHPAMTPSPTNREQLTEQFTRDMLQRNVTISFWGKVLDQNDQPVPSANVVLAARQWTSAAPNSLDATHEKRELTTDSEGRFELLGASGDVLNLESVQKPGYRLSDKTQRAFAYAKSATIFQPDPQNPVIIRMWKLGPAEPLVSTRTLFGFQPDGRPYTLDLLAKKKTEGENQTGDLVIKFNRSQITGTREPYTWGLEISAIGGGVQETTNEQTFLAPPSGYQPKVTIQMNQEQPNWAPSLTKDFYISTRNGTVFAAVHMEIQADYSGQSAIFVQARANQNSSRNLQP